MDEPLGKKGREGVLASMASHKEFLACPEQRIRFVHVPEHTSWLNPIEIVVAPIARKVVRRGRYASKEALRERLLRFIGYFNRVFAKPFRCTFTGRPLQDR